MIAMKKQTIWFMKPFSNQKNLAPLAATFFFSGIWDTVAGMIYLFHIGDGRKLDELSMDPFYAAFLGSFFLCFAFLQFLSSMNIRRYSFNVGCLIIGRLFYVILLYTKMAFVEGFPSTFWFTGIIDISFVILYLVFAVKGGQSLSQLFIPEIDTVKNDSVL
jgi:hypothetical protein